MQVQGLALPDLKLITPAVHRDERGFFLETYHQNKYAQAGIECAFVQDNCSFSKQGTIRGMHFQATPGQAKLVSVIQGEIFDVAVDIRMDSPTFGKWVGVYLDSVKRQQLFVPVGFAHGFCVVSKDALVVYKVSHIYQAEEERTFHCHDPDVGIKWPVSDPILSEKDRKAPLLKELILYY